MVATNRARRDFNRMLGAIRPRRQINAIFRRDISQEFAIATAWAIFGGEVADLSVFGYESHSAMPQSAASTTGTAKMTDSQFFMRLGLLIAFTIASSWLMYILYLVIKAAVRDGIKESGVKLELMPMPEYEWNLASLKKDKLVEK